MNSALWRNTHIDQGHDPESKGHLGDDDALSVQRVSGVVVEQHSCSSGHAAAEMIHVWRGRFSPVGRLDTVFLCQERISHKGTNESAQTDEEMQNLG